MTWLRNLFAGEMANSAIRQFVIWPVGLFALCLFSSMTPRCQIRVPSGLWWPLGDWLAVGVGTKKVHAFLNVRYNTHKYRTQWKYYKYTISGVWLLCQDLLLWWHYTDGFYRSTVYSVHHCEIQIHKFAKTRKFDPLQRLVAALCLTGRVGEYVEDTHQNLLWRYNCIIVRWRYNCEIPRYCGCFTDW